MRPDPLPRSFRRSDILPAALTLATLIVAARLFRFFMVPYSLAINFDEGCETAAVERIITGRWLPYVDAASIRGPFLYWSQGILQTLTGRFEFTGVRILGLICALVTVSMTFLAGWAAGWPLAGAIGSATYIFIVAIVYPTGGGMGVAGESVAIAFMTTAFFIVGYALNRARSERGRNTLLALGGVVVGIASLTKQTQAVACIPMFVWIFAGSISDAVPTPSRPSLLTRTIVMRLLSFCLGGLGLVALVLLRYAVAGELKTFFFWSIGFGASIYMAPFKGQRLETMSAWFISEPWAILGAALAAAIAWGRPLAAFEERSTRGLLMAVAESAFEVTVGLMALALLVAAAIANRVWPHYFVAVYPFFGMTLGILIESFLRRDAAVPWPAQGPVVVVVGALLVWAGVHRLHGLEQEREHGSWKNPRPDPACAEIDRIAGPGHEPIFVWGTAGDLYVACQRSSVSMFTSTIMIAGIVPPFWNADPARVAPGTQEKLLDELKTRRPPVLLDHEMAAGATMMDFPFLASFVNQGYCKVSTVPDGGGRSITFYGRNDLDACRLRDP